MRALLSAVVLLGLVLFHAAQGRDALTDDGHESDRYWRSEQQVQGGAPTPERDSTARAVYLSDLLKIPEYRFAYNRLMRPAPLPPTWLRRFNQAGDGVQMGVKSLTIAKRPYEIARVCRPRATSDCLDVVFSMDDGPVSWGYLSHGDEGAWIGVPPLPLAEAVEAKLADPDFWN